MPVEALDKVVTLKLSARQKRRLHSEARRRGLRFGVWARNVLLAAIDTGGVPKRTLSAPVLPK